MKILLVEDEKALSDIIKEMLEKNNYLVDAAYDGKTAYHMGKDMNYDLILLDVMLPEMDGFTVLQKLREAKIETPIIMLTAKTEIDDKVRGLEGGADDYIAKPFDNKELLARIASALRRKNNPFVDHISFGDLILDKDKLCIRKGENSFLLSVKEFQILELLMINQSMIISREKMIEKIWGYDYEGESKIVEVYISVIRKKLKSISANEKIKSVRSLGYRMVNDND